MNDITDDSLSNGKILIADDNETNLSFLSEFINLLGCKTFLAKNGEEAIEMAKTTNPDVMLLDIIMPEKDGFQVLDALKRENIIHKFPVIVISADDNIDNIVRCIEMGADDYLIKPFHSVILKARIKNSLEKKFRTDQEEQIKENLSKSNEELKTLEQARDSLSHILVHDLNNPLSTIKGYTQYLSMKSEKTHINNEDIAKNLNKISSSVSDMESLIKGILDVSKLESEKMKIEKTEFDIVSFSRNLFEDFLIRVDQARKCDFSSSLENCLVFADQPLLSRVIQNLLSNALKHTSRQSNINLTITEENEKIVLIFKDTGYGIPDAVKGKIFDKFVQIEGKKIGKKYGVGLGLYFCKIAMDAMGGSIEVESQEGVGSSFFVKIEKSRNE